MPGALILNGDTMISLKDKTYLVTGVGDNVGFGWHIAKKIQHAGGDVILAVHPRVAGIVNKFLTKDKYADSRLLNPQDSGNKSEFSPVAVLKCDVSVDSGEDGIDELVNSITTMGKSLDGIVHSVAFSPEAKKPHFETSRDAYLTAMSVSSYSLVAMCNKLYSLMNDESSVAGLTYIASQRCIPFYGGGMSSAKAALECDARALSWHMGEEKKIRVNMVSPGPYASRAAKGIADIDAAADEVATRSPLRRRIEADDVANAVLFFMSNLSSNITGETLYVDAGYHIAM